ncbi:MAG TPA: M28 family peptidase [Bacteroidales bacterium]|nr:M28 family peptidase [Bacteroidales bacterium]
MTSRKAGYLVRLVFSFQVIFLLGSAQAECQPAWYFQWNLLKGDAADYLIGASSGEQAYNTIADLSDYNRIRKPDEFTGTLFEAGYIADKLKSYGLEDVNIERLGKASVYNPVKGELWEISPGLDKIADVKDLPFTLYPGSPDGDTEGNLVYINDAFNSSGDHPELSGKVVLTPLRPDVINRRVHGKNVRGIISYYSPRPLEDKLMIPDSKGGGFTHGVASEIFQFSISPRDGEILKARLLKGESIRVRASVSARTETIDIQVPTCCIKGTDPGAGEIIISAHLFEGYSHEGANDNISGAAAILEVARVISTSISRGRLERPKRTIRFIWVPEYSGSIRWVNAHREIINRSLCDINLDMVGLSISKYKSFFVLHRTSFGNAHYVNDVLENFYRYVGETNQMNSVISGSTFFKRIVAPSGTDDPFYYQVESSSGGSDHDVFNDWGVRVPGVLLITWPDPFYHTSLDRTDKIDPTQLKRVVFITAASAYSIASAGEREAIGISGEVYGNSVKRIGYQVTRALDEINTSDAKDLYTVLRRCLSNLKGTSLGEIMTLNSVTQLSPGSQSLESVIKEYASSVNLLSESAAHNLVKTASLKIIESGGTFSDLKPTREEKIAMTLVPRIVADPRDTGYEGYNKKIDGLPEEITGKYSISGLEDPFEAAGCINGRNSILDIRDLLNAQKKSETSLTGLMNFFYRLQAAGFIKL